MATVIKGNPAAQVAYLNRKAEALRRKVRNGPVNKTKRARKDHENAQLSEKAVSKKAETATKRAAVLGISADGSAKKSADTKPTETK